MAEEHKLKKSLSILANFANYVIFPVTTICDNNLRLKTEN